MIQYAKTFGEADYISSLIKKFKKKKKNLGQNTVTIIILSHTSSQWQIY